MFFAALPVAIMVFVGPDILLIRRTSHPMMQALDILDARQPSISPS